MESLLGRSLLYDTRLGRSLLYESEFSLSLLIRKNTELVSVFSVEVSPVSFTSGALGFSTGFYCLSSFGSTVSVASVTSSFPESKPVGDSPPLPPILTLHGTQSPRDELEICDGGLCLDR